MKAIVQEAYGPAAEVLRLREVEPPSVGDDEVLVRVRAASVHPDVWHVVTGTPYVLRFMGAGVRSPKHPIPGTDLAGVIEAVGRNVTTFQAGDTVFGESHRGFQWRNGGTYAEYVAVPHDVVTHKPRNVSFDQAAAVGTSGIIALFNLQNGKRLESAKRVLVNGAAGGVGSIVVQLAKAYGASVTGVDRTEKLSMLRSLGADEVIDYTEEDFTQRGERFDLIFDVASNLLPARCKASLSTNGVYIALGHDHFGASRGRLWGSLPQMFTLMAMAPFVEYLPNPEFASPRKHEALTILKEMLENWTLKPVIDRTYPLSGVPDAIRFLESGLARGKIIVRP